MLYILLFIFLFVAELAYFRLANHFNIIDKPNERSSHTKITLRGGGIIFYMGILLYFIVNGFPYIWFFSGLTLISIISFADDVKPQSSKLRLGIHFISMTLMFNEWDLYSHPWFYVLIALILCTGILNAYNFMDGINGITGAYSLVVIACFWYINNFMTIFIDNQLLYILALSLFVFNWFNFRTKAKCFAGDIGSVSIAFTVVFLLGMLVVKTNDVSYIVLLSVYGVDTVLTIIYRLILKENIFKPHRRHLFQLMANEWKLPHILVSGIYASLQLIIFMGYIFFFNSHTSYFILSIFALCIVYLSLYKYMIFRNNQILTT